MSTELPPRQPLKGTYYSLDFRWKWEETHQVSLYRGHQWEAATEDCIWVSSERRDHTLKVRPEGSTWCESRTFESDRTESRALL